MSAEQDRLLARAGKGALAGVVLGLVAWLCAALAGLLPMQDWPRALLLVLGAAVACGVGQVAARGIVGAALGALIGFLAGDLLAGAGTPRSPGPSLIGTEARIAGPTLEGTTLEGTTFDIKALRGKVVLVDFWATWCQPCLAELPHVRQLYERHKDEGFRVVGISLDTSREKLARFVEREKLPWPQIFFREAEQPGWQNPLAQQYGVAGIPYTLLVDREGRIVAEGLRGRDMERAVKKILAGNEVGPPGSEGAPALVLWGATLCGWVVGVLLERRIRLGPEELRPAEERP
jgi:thiol-disulfide isomerase/thioredoxin